MYNSIAHKTSLTYMKLLYLFLHTKPLTNIFLSYESHVKFLCANFSSPGVCLAPMGSSGVSGSLTQILVPFAQILSNLELPKILITSLVVTTSALVQLLSDSVNTFIQNFRVSGPDLCNYSRNHFLSRCYSFDFHTAN